MIGTRRDKGQEGLLQAGEFGLVSGVWMGRAPDGRYANLSAHDVEEHGDGTITVKPSIKITDENGEWHGYLTRGVWRECR